MHGKFQQEEHWSVKFINYLSYLETEKSSEEVKFYVYYQLLIPLLFRVKKTAIFTFRGIYNRKQRKSTSEGTKADRRRRQAVISKGIYFPQR